jgi:hypothetical protein
MRTLTWLKPPKKTSPLEDYYWSTIYYYYKQMDKHVIKAYKASTIDDSKIHCLFDL